MRFPAILLSLALAFALSLPARGQAILRDSEIERGIVELAKPLIIAAGLSPSSVKFLLIKNDAINAAVIDGQTIIIYTGLFLRMERAEMLQGVIAHELAHIANGHLTRRAANARVAQRRALLGLAVSALAAAQGSQAAAGIAAGSISAAQRSFFSHTRAEEAAADQAGVRYMVRAGISPQGLVDVMELFRGQEDLTVNTARLDPYVLTHPLSRERVRALQGFAAAHSDLQGTTPESEYWFQRSRAKLSAYIRNPQWTFRRISSSDTSDAARVGRAVAYSKQSNTDAALREIDALLTRSPDDFYAQELRAWLLFEGRRFKEAADAYAVVAEKAPRNPLILAGYGQALLAVNTRASNAEALDVLTRARARDSFNPSLLRSLATAQARAGLDGEASLSTAERYALAGRLNDARIHARRALGLLPRGSPGWQRADDIVAAAEAAGNRRR